ncbi:MAG: AAA family ATPase [Paludibacteraceae bacterium]|nr:AAA family ATPase [Paludibacteraceae bacterium]
MKLGKLQIHNLASIGDATIDFESQPLSDCEVFLITGKTGSGKTTILDAICLALYADTPRLGNTKMQGRFNEGSSDITIKDPRQLMRRQTAEAWVVLTFTGSNGIHYQATWSVSRARKKTTGNLQSKSWELKNLDTNFSFTKDDEIKSEMQRAIGLDFDQFCRTTLLAQGEFTRFLNSKDDEKAEILEKITGVDIYSKIGAKIYEITSSKKQDYDEARLKTEGINTLSDTDIQSKKDEIETLNAQLGEQLKAVDTQRTKQQWLIRNNELLRLVADAQNKLQETQDNVNSDDFKADLQLLSLWDKTTQARQLLAEAKQADKIIEEQKQNIEQLCNQYRKLEQGKAYLEQHSQLTEKHIDEINTLLEKEQPHAAIYDNAQNIAGFAATIISSNSFIEQQTQAIKKEKILQSEELEPVLRNAVAVLQEAERKIEDLKTQEQAKSKQLSELQLPSLREQLQAEQDGLRLTDKAILLLKNLNEAIARARKTEENLTKMQNELQEKKASLQSLEAKRQEALVKLNTCKDLFNKQKDTIESFSKTIRARLQIGDVCPVCRQEVTAKNWHEDELQLLVIGLQQSAIDAENDYNSIAEQCNQLNAQINSLENSYKRDKSVFVGDRSLNDSRQAALTACQELGLSIIDDSTKNLLQELFDAKNRNITAIKTQLSYGESKEAEIKNLHTIIETSLTELNRLRDAQTDAQRAITDSMAKISIATQLLAGKQKEQKDAVSKLSEQINGSMWQQVWQDTPNLFGESLINKAAQYNKLLQDHRTLSRQLDIEQNTIHNVALIFEQISTLLSSIPQYIAPENSNLQTLQPEKTDNLQSTANLLYANLSTAIGRANDAQSTKLRNSQLINSFIKQNTELSASKLEQLCSISSTQIDAIRDNINKANNTLLEQQTVLTNYKKQSDEHQQRKPLFVGDENLESITTAIADIENSMHSIEQQKGAIMQLLATDADSKKRLGTLIEAAQERQKEYERWARLNRLVGDQTGKKFRTIAQSYILASLTEAANKYMLSLTDRYTLQVVPGTFIISIEDAYQGFATRPVSTISGGEGFLVSLALALALSDIGQQLAVDTLFIDEGFGTLSGEPLRNAIQMLKTLRSKAGRKVGIISHIEEVQERIPMQIRVEQEGHNSLSKVTINN